MSANINLISKSSLEDSRNKRLRKLKNYSFVLLFFVGFSSLLIFLLNYRFSVNYVIRQEQVLIKEISVYDDTALKLVLLNSRLDTISQVLGQRKNLSDPIRAIMKGKSESLTIKEFNIGESGAIIKISSRSLLPINNFLNNLLKLGKTSYLSAVNISTFSYEDKIYSLEISIN